MEHHSKSAVPDRIPEGDTPPAVRDFLAFLTVARGCSEKTVSEYRRDLRTFFRFLLPSGGGAAQNGATVQDGETVQNGEGARNGEAVQDAPERWPEGIDETFLRAVTQADLNRYIAWLRTEKTVSTGRADTVTPGLAPATTRRRAACLRSFFRYLTENAGLLDRDPSAGLVVPKKNAALPFFFTEEECQTLLEAVDGLNRERDYAIVLLALVSGLRVSEIVSLNVHDIRSTEGLFFFRVTGKGGKERQVYLSGNCIEALDRYLTVRETYLHPSSSPSRENSPSRESSPGRENSQSRAGSIRPEDRDALFLSRKRRRLSVDAVQSLVKRAARRAGLTPVSPHKLRHTAASLMLGHGVDIRTISEVLGHSSISSTQIYTHLQSAQLIEACRANPVSRIGTERDRLPQSAAAPDTGIAAGTGNDTGNSMGSGVCPIPPKK